MRRKDALRINYFLGASTIMFLFGIFFLIIPRSNGDTKIHRHIKNSHYALSFTLFFVYIPFACAFCIKVYNYYEINYLYIFEFDPQHKMTSDQFLNVGSMMLLVWTTCFALANAEVDLDYIFGESAFIWPSFISVFLLIFYCF